MSNINTVEVIKSWLNLILQAASHQLQWKIDGWREPAKAAADWNRTAIEHNSLPTFRPKTVQSAGARYFTAIFQFPIPFVLSCVFILFFCMRFKFFFFDAMTTHI